MKATELRIGNLFDFTIDGSGYLPVEEIRKDSEGFIGHYAVFRNGSIKCLVEEDSMDAIPITEEWLTKLGAEFYKKNYALNAGGELFEYVDFNNKLCLWYDKRRGLTIDQIPKLDATYYVYVHQLQNLYFALTGEELTIK